MDSDTIFICQCHNVEHQLIMYYDHDDDTVYVTMHLRTGSFWSRLKTGMRYIFGRKSRYGHFDEFIFNEKDAGKLEEIARRLRGISKV